MYEGENSLSEWVQWLGSGRNVSTVSAGAAFRGPDGVVKVGGRAPLILNLDSIPFPVRDPVNMPPYKAYPPRYTLGRQATMMATRGCPYRCQFCSTTRYWGSRYRTRSVENVLQELELLTLDRKVEYVHFFDDALTARKQWILELCNEIARRRLRFDWEAITRVNYVDEDICRAMRKAGCKSVIFGVESFSDKILNTIHKGVTGGQAIEALKTAGKTGLKTTCLLMVGNPGESWETIKETACGIRSARPTHMDVCLTAVFPKTELYEIATRAGLLDDTYWLNESLSAPIFTVEHSIDTLQKFRDVLYDAYWSCRWFVSLYRKSGLRKLRHRLAKRQEYPGKGQVARGEGTP